MEGLGGKNFRKFFVPPDLLDDCRLLLDGKRGSISLSRVASAGM